MAHTSTAHHQRDMAILIVFLTVVGLFIAYVMMRGLPRCLQSDMTWRAASSQFGE